MKPRTKRLNVPCCACVLLLNAAWCRADTPAPATASANPAAPTASAPAENAPPLSKQEASYWLGVNYGAVMRNYDVTMEILPDEVQRGFHDGLAGKKAPPDMQRRIREFIGMVQPVAAQLHATAAKEFLDHNLHERGIMTTASGLQYKVLVKGDPRASGPKEGDQVSVQYRGTLLDGTEFDNSYSRGAPITIPLAGTVKGWQEGLQLMQPGAKWRLFVPPELGYGAAPRPGIPGNSLLIFEVELLKVAPATSANANATQSGTTGQ